MNSFAGAEQAQGAAQTAALGAKAGSIVPGVGTVIGAVVGAVVGWLAFKKKPPRPTAQEIADCKTLLSDYMGFAAQMPTQPIPLDQEQLRQLNWCMDAVYGSKIGLRDPRYFDPDVAGTFIPMARQTVRKIYETPVGQTVNLGEISFSFRGQTFKFKGYSFVNPTFTNLKTFCDQYFIPMAVQMCKETAGKGAGGCEDYYGQLPEFRRWLYDLLAWAARSELPNISEADLAAASQVATTVPGSSAKDVVSAVESIIGRTVKSGETSAILTPATAPPAPNPTVPTTSPTETPPTNVSTLPVVSLPTIVSQLPVSSSVTQTLPEVPTVQPLPFAPGAPGTDFNIAPLAPVSSGKLTTPQATAQTSSVSPWLIGGGLLAVLLLTKKRKHA